LESFASQMKIKTLLRFFFILLTCIFIDSFVLERYLVRFPVYEYQSEKIPEAFDGYRIALVSDLHLGFLDPEIWVRWVIKQVNKQNPDLIVGLGDYVKKRNTDTELLRVWPLLLSLKAQDKVFFVNGNHDHWANHKLALTLLKDTKRSLRNQHHLLIREKSEITIAGTGDYWTDAVDIDESLKQSPTKNFKIIATHNPDATETKHKTEIDLYLAGHTHGGQVRIPIFDYSPVLPIKSSRLDKGFRKNKFGEDVFISAGIGWSILPIRFFCPAEVPIIVLRSKIRR
jgi:predicted MPP superfamily phosphohydrolase